MSQEPSDQQEWVSSDIWILLPPLAGAHNIDLQKKESQSAMDLIVDRESHIPNLALIGKVYQLNSMQKYLNYTVTLVICNLLIQNIFQAL